MALLEGAEHDRPVGARQCLVLHGVRRGGERATTQPAGPQLGELAGQGGVDDAGGGWRWRRVTESMAACRPAPIGTVAIIVAIVGCFVIWRMDATRAEEVEHPSPRPGPRQQQLRAAPVSDQPRHLES
ncbi:hypothetical protein [Nocardioides sp.]|uniref:hypothetical protein n=1 Tax=Nocardioides sp. TaxID=35761 RepID=UPI002603B62A|nr:hypothetical protein [Nocardioides sp.]MCW2737984.1 hypothetical protein [Nocardioides sp.]